MSISTNNGEKPVNHRSSQTEWIGHRITSTLIYKIPHYLAYRYFTHTYSTMSTYFQHIRSVSVTHLPLSGLALNKVIDSTHLQSCGCTHSAYVSPSSLENHFYLFLC